MLKDKVEKYDALKLELQKCKKCDLRRQVCYYATGPITATVMVIGQAPSLYRKSEEHFSEMSRNIFNKFLDELHLTKEDIWITNAIKCVEPHKRTGVDLNCKSYLKREIKIVQPNEIFLMGCVATHAVFGSAKPYKSFKEKGITYHVMPHPMVVLYDPEEGKKKFLDALKRVKEYRQTHRIKVRKQLTLEGI